MHSECHLSWWQFLSLSSINFTGPFMLPLLFALLVGALRVSRAALSLADDPHALCSRPNSWSCFLNDWLFMTSPQFLAPSIWWLWWYPLSPQSLLLATCAWPPVQQFLPSGFDTYHALRWEQYLSYINGAKELCRNPSAILMFLWVEGNAPDSFALGMESKTLGRKSTNPALLTPPSTLDTRTGSVLPSDMHIRNLC